jgi:hypothetical protein
VTRVLIEPARGVRAYDIAQRSSHPALFSLCCSLFLALAGRGREEEARREYIIALAILRQLEEGVQR